MPLDPGTRLGPYEIVAPLGAGGMGEVYRARDVRLGREVAVKILPAELAGDPDFRRRFEREARTVSQLAHPNVCALFDAGRAPGEAGSGDIEYLVMELLEGETLAERLAKGRIPMDQVLRHGAEIAAALGAAHARGIVHRDLKPANIMLTPAGVKLLDFGLAKTLERAGAGGGPASARFTTSLTGEGTLLGTVPYMAPEQVEGRPVDAKTDIFALGAVLFEMAAGTRAFAGASQAAVLSEILTHDPPPLSALRPGVPPALDRLVGRCLARDPAARWSSALDLELQLREMAAAAGPARRRAVPRAAWFALAAVALLAVIVLGWQLRRRAAPATTAASLAVFPFENVSDPADSSRMGAITGNLLVTAIAQAPGTDVLSTQRVLEVLHQMGRREAGDRGIALAAARRARAARLVTGSILRLEPTIVMTAELSDVRSGRVIAAERIEGRPGQTLFEVVDGLGGSLLRRITPALAAGSLAPVLERTSSDLAAQRRYGMGLEHLAAGELPEAETEFRAAVERDPGFAQAWYHLAVTRWWLNEVEGAVDAVTRASALAGRLTPSEREVISGVEALVDRRYQSATAIFARLSRAQPGDRTVQYALEEALFHASRYPEAIEQARALLAADPGFTLAGIHLVDALAVSGELERADSTAVALLARNPHNMPLHRSLFVVRLRRGDLDGALTAAEAARRQGTASPAWLLASMLLVMKDRPAAARDWLVNASPPGEAWEHDPGAVDYWYALRNGRFRAALEISRKAWAVTPRRGSPRFMGVPLADGLDAAAGARDLARAQALADSVGIRLRLWGVPNAPVVGPLLSVDIRLRLGRTSEAAALLRDFERRVEARPENAQRSLAFARAQVMSAEGRGAEALALLPHAIWYGNPAITLGMATLERARALTAAGRPAEAIGVLDTLIRAPMLSPDEAVRLRLYRGRLLEKEDRPREAAADYRALLVAWKDADPGLPEVAEARAALARLEKTARR